MCGIIGVFEKRPGMGADLGRLNAARDVMIRRGPDAAGDLCFEGTDGCHHYMGHRRLSIQDLSDLAAQPMTSASGRFSIVYNGEVYNVSALTKEINDQGVTLKSTSDTEVILEGYALWGPSVIEKLNGMFALAIWDHRENALFVARDRIGIKPLYVTQNEAGFAFASDVRALRDLGYGDDLDQEALALYLMLGYVPAPRSIWSGIEKLEAGTTLLWTADREARKSTYWSAPTETDFEQSVPDLEDLIDEVVEEHLLSDVPLGLFLSGGIDSSVIAASIAGMGHHKADITALTVAYPDVATGDEAPVAERTAKILGMDLHRLELGARNIPSFKEAAGTLDEPLAYNAVVSQTAISELAAQTGLKVVLTGDGGDEVFGGYRWYADVPDTVDAVRTGWVERLKQLKPSNRLRVRERNMAASFRGQCKLFDHAARLFPAFRPEQTAQLLGTVTADACSDLLREALSRHDAPGMHWKRRRQRIDLYTFCQDVCLPKVDRAGMAFSIEARPPLLDHRIVEWGLSRPVTETYDAAPKNALRRIVENRGLGFLLSEPKRGFSLKMAATPDTRTMSREIDAQASALGLSDHWAQISHRRTQNYQYMMDTLYFLCLWRHAQHS
ncbi:MAG: asparagine synthase (glutamine-hydrolyzing) [Pseudomonadota bacterium]